MKYFISIIIIWSSLYTKVQAQVNDSFYAPPFTIVKHEFLSSNGPMWVMNNQNHCQQLPDSSLMFYFNGGAKDIDFTFENAPGFPGDGRGATMFKVNYDKTLTERKAWLIPHSSYYSTQPYIFFNQPNGDVIGIGVTSYIPSKVYDVGVERRDSMGTLLWFKHYGGSGAEYAPIAKQAPDGGIIGMVWFHGPGDGDMTRANCGELYSADVWVFKIDPDGNLRYSTVIGGEQDDVPMDLVVNDDGSCFVTIAAFRGDCDPSKNKGVWDLGVAYLDKDGNKVWVNNYGGSHVDAPSNGYSVTADGSGGIYVACQTLSTDGDIQREAIVDMSDMLPVWLVHINSSGTLLYETRIPFVGFGSNPDVLYRDDDGTLWLGLTIRTPNIPGYYYTDTLPFGVVSFIMHLDTLGNVLHKRTIGSGQSMIKSIRKLANGNLLAVFTHVVVHLGAKSLSPGFPERTDSLYAPRIVFMEFNGITDTVDYHREPAIGFNIYPNPLNDLLTIEAHKTGNYLISIFLNDGRKMHQFPMKDKKHQESLAHLSTGLYTLVITEKGSKKTLKTWKIVKK